MSADAALPASWLRPRWRTSGVAALMTSREGGIGRPPFDSFNLSVSPGDDPAVVARHHALLAAAVPARPVWLRQVHGRRVLRLRADTATGVPAVEADASVTTEPGVACAVMAADCLPVLMVAGGQAQRRGVAAAHAGWRGLCAGVLEATVAAMRTPPDRLMAWLGPAAGPQAYEIGEEVFDAFTARDGRARMAFLPTRPGHWKVDLYTLARQRLLDAGVFDVHGGGLCTISDPARFFSHRRDGRSGRIATLAWIAP